jgi:4-deoxy-L-threo-5-hexosulose-uronate ketol-isomerase
MEQLKIIHAVAADDFLHYDTKRIRSKFLMDALAQAGQVRLYYTHYDRLIAGVAMPLAAPLPLGNYENLKSQYFLERREIGIINVGGAGKVHADGQTYQLKKLDCLYAGKGVRQLVFESDAAGQPAVFFLLSAPAHHSYPTTLMKSTDAAPVHLGAMETANQRTIYKYIHLDGIKSCQLVMGLTVLKTGSVWNSIPPHTHDRRSEVYFYFDLPEEQRIFHLMGQPQETRHIVVKNHEAVVSPSWSIHAGSGTTNYSFIWGMGGENLEFTDMDPAPVNHLL